MGYTPRSLMTLNVRNEEADMLARELARIDRSTIIDAVIVALKETIENRIRQETPRETAQRILATRGLSFKADRKPVSADAYHDLDHGFCEND